MTTAVVTADRLTPYQEVARLLVEHQISCLPVLAHGWQVIGVVSETDLLAARNGTARRGQAAGELMTAPPVTIRPDGTLSAAARMMTRRHVTSLPVTGADRELIGIVSRRDLLSVFLRPDGDITGDVGHVLDQLPLGDPPGVTMTVRHGVVTLAGVIMPRPGQHPDLVRTAMFKGETLRSMLLNAYGWWKVSQITYIASLAAFGLAGLTVLASLAALTLGRKPEITHETITGDTVKTA